MIDMVPNTPQVLSRSKSFALEPRYYGPKLPVIIRSVSLASRKFQRVIGKHICGKCFYQFCFKSPLNILLFPSSASSSLSSFSSSCFLLLLLFFFLFLFFLFFFSSSSSSSSSWVVMYFSGRGGGGGGVIN